MYKIIGADGQEYGPVTAEQLRQWIREGRVNAQTQVQAEGSAEWKPVSAFPEFTDVISAPTPPSPGSSASAATQSGQVLPRSNEIDIGRCISRAWNLVTNNFWRMVGTSLLVFLILGGVGGALRVAINAVCGVPFFTPGLHGPRLFRLLLPGIVVSSLWNILMGGPLLGGLYNYYLKLIRGQPATVGDAFAGFSGAFGSLIVTQFVIAVLTVLGCCLCLIPGIYLAIAWKFSLPLVIEKRMGFWEAMEMSRKAATRQWWSLFALILLSGLITLSGFILCCVGIFATAPIGIAAILYAYEDIFGSQAASQAG